MGQAWPPWWLPAGLPWLRPWVAITWQIRMSLLAMKSAHEHVVVGLAGIVQEQPAKGLRLAGMDPVEICKKYAKNMQLHVKNMTNFSTNMQIYRLY